jgi:hypothetical protein
MDKVNVWIFGEYPERISETAYSVQEVKGEGWHLVIDILLLFLYY